MSDDRFPVADIVRIPKPWGHELIWARTDRYVGKILHVSRGESLSLQYHEMKDETLLVIRGRAKVTLRRENQEGEIILEVGQALHIPPGLIHRIEGLEDTDIVEVSTPELQDVVRLEDRYGRIAMEEADK